MFQSPKRPSNSLLVSCWTSKLAVSYLEQREMSLSATFRKTRPCTQGFIRVSSRVQLYGTATLLSPINLQAKCWSRTSFRSLSRSYVVKCSSKPPLHRISVQLQTIRSKTSTRNVASSSKVGATRDRDIGFWEHERASCTQFLVVGAVSHEIGTRRAHVFTGSRLCSA